MGHLEKYVLLIFINKKMSVRHHKYINSNYIIFIMSNRQKICGCELVEQPSTNR